MSSFTISGRKNRNTSLILSAILINLGLFFIYIFIWVIGVIKDETWKADFTSFYTSAAIVWAGQGEDLYNIDTQTELQGQFLQGYVRPSPLIMEYVNPPHVAIILSPLAMFSREAAYLIWAGIQAIFLLILIAQLLRFASSWSTQEKFLLIASCLGLHFLLLNFYLGALSLIMLVSLLEFYELLIENKEGRSGISLALGSLKPQNTILIAAMLVGARRWKALSGAILTTVLILAITTAFLGWKIWLSYVAVLVNHANLFGSLAVDPRTMYNLKGALSIIFQQSNLEWINAVSYGSLIACILLVGWIWANVVKEKTFIELPLAITALLGLVFSPHLNPQDGLLIIFPALLFYKHLRRGNASIKPYAVFCSVSPAVFFAAEFVIGDRFGFRLPFAAMTILLVWMIVEWIQQNKLSSQDVEEFNQ
jgi:hypothetical protein